MKRLATIDLGTNTVRVLVVQAEGGDWRILTQAQRVTRLGQGQATSGALRDEPMARTLATVAEFVAIAERFGVSEIRIVATSAVREAANREEFVARVQTATGRSVEVVSGAEEARLTLLGVSAGLPDLGSVFLLFDIGGGSTEFVVADAGRSRAAVSLRIGVVPLAERFMDSGPVDWKRYDAMARELDGRLAAEIPPAIMTAKVPVLVGTAGTVTTLAALDLGLTTYDAGRVHGHRLARPAVERQLRRLGALTLEQRAALPCLEPGRADVLIPGIAICLAAMERLGFASLVVSDRGLREGIMRELLAAPASAPRSPRSVPE